MPKSMTFYSEGVKLAGDLLLPADIKPGERRAGIVLCHGSTGVRSIYLPDNARVLAEAGYVVLNFDYKGWGDSDGAKTRLAPYSRVADVQAALTFMSAQPRGGRGPPRHLRHQLRRRDRGVRRRHRSAGQMRGFGGRHRQRSTLDAERAPPGRVP